MRPRTTVASPVDPGDDAARAAAAATMGRRAETCTVCGVALGDSFSRRAKSGKTFCRICADLTVAAYYRRHPEARPAPDRIARERTGTAYIAERERYEVRYHAGHGHWQISDTQARRWTSLTSDTEATAQAAAQAMNDAWRAQLAHERDVLGSRALPSTAPLDTRRVGEATYGVDPA
jgi:hypothetical protein